MTNQTPFTDTPKQWLGDLPVNNRYTYGIAGERFFRSIKNEGKIIGTHCPDCNKTFVPPLIFCAYCLRDLDQWVEVGNTGIVETYTLVYQSLDGSRIDPPEIVAFIRIADGGMLHKLENISYQDVKIGMQVAAILKPEDERIGAITDIISFRPLTT